MYSNTQYLFNLNVLNVNSIKPKANPITKAPDRPERRPRIESDTC